MDETTTGYQAYKEKYNETVAAPNAPLLRVIRPPDDKETESKRTELIGTAEELLEHDMDELKEATHVHNLEIQKHFDAIMERARHFEAKLHDEEVERDASIGALRLHVTQAFDSAYECMETKAIEAFHVRLEDTIPKQETRASDFSAAFDEFVNVTVPGIIEALQGTITRRLEKSHETFDIDNSKLLKREKKMRGHIETHERRTAQAFTDEKDRRVTTFVALEEAIHTTMQLDDRHAERKQGSMIETIVALRAQYDDERLVREKEDAALLERVAETMERLHVSILESFGEEK